MEVKLCELGQNLFTLPPGSRICFLFFWAAGGGGAKTTDKLVLKPSSFQTKATKVTLPQVASPGGGQGNWQVGLV